MDTSSADTGSSQTISFGFSASRAAMRDALPLAAGELVRVAAVELRPDAHLFHQLAHRASRSRAVPIK
jgi:hypothetical protein